MTTLATLSEAIRDVAIAFSFEFNGARWTFVVRNEAKLGRFPRVDVFEDGEVVGAGYLPDHEASCPQEDGPMFDGHHSTPIGGKSLESPGDEDELFQQWGEKLFYEWNRVARAYRATRR